MNGAEGVSTRRQGMFAALRRSVLASAIGSKMRQGRGVGGLIYKQWECVVILDVQGLCTPGVIVRTIALYSKCQRTKRLTR